MEHKWREHKKQPQRMCPIPKISLVKGTTLVKTSAPTLISPSAPTMPFPVPPQATVYLTPKPLHILLTLFSTTTTISAAMSSAHGGSTKPNSQNAPEPPQNYPIPLSPPLPSISKDIELARAMSASSKSTLFQLSKSDVIYEDEWLIAVNKPQGVYCESVLASASRVLVGQLPQGTRLSEPELHLANRLDRDTSGVMVITKSHKVAAKLVKAFTDHKVCKTYVALSIGSAPKWERITIKSGHGRSKFGAWRVYAASDVGRTLPGDSVVRDMETSFEVLSVNGQGSFKEINEFRRDEDNVIVVEEKADRDDAKEDEILVRAFPRSGRTHQIRLHCQYLGMSIRGDVKYEGVYEWKGRTYDGHELHAESLSFEHPITGLPVKLRASLPLWAIQALPSSPN